ncbi:MAG: MFS transporter [Alphaproteobacteria bacterium]|nr:MFS transporter [Alphaproteobacteria bacterium]
MAEEGTARAGEGGRKLSVGITASYAASEYGKAIYHASLNMVWLFFLTDVVGIPPAIGGTIMLTYLVWDAITDPIMGFIADRTRTKWGKYRPYIFFGAPLTSIALVLAFTKPPFDLHGAIVYAFLTSIALRTAYTIVDVPHNSLLALATPSSRERSTLAGAKMTTAALAGLTISLSVMPILQGEGASEEAGRFTVAAMIGGAIAVAALWLCVWAFRDVDRRREPTPPSKLVSLPDFYRVLIGNSYVCIIFAVWVVTMMTLPTFAKSLIYFAKYNLQDEGWASVALATMTIGQAATMPLWALFATRVAKARVLQLAQLLSLVTLATIYFANPHDKLFLQVLIFLEGAAIGGSYSIAMSILPDLVEHSEWRTGKRVEAGIFGMATLAIKAGNGIGVGLFGVFLGAVGYVANASLSPETLDGMRLIMTALPGAGAVVAILALSFYGLDHREHARIREELAKRNGSGD